MSITEHATLADRIRELRKHFGLTQQELANKLGVPRGRVSNWEGGGGMGKASVQRLREVFGVTRGWLFEGEGSLPANQDKRASGPSEPLSSPGFPILAPLRRGFLLRLLQNARFAFYSLANH